MKVVILAGGLGTRISEESHLKPKPMIEIGSKPMLWHIMKIYSHYGFNDFIICCGYKSFAIKEYFSNYFLYNSDVTFDMKKNSMTVHQNMAEPWTVTLVDTGEHTMTGGRIKKIKDYVKNEDFCVTYGDGLANINILELANFHKSHGQLATVTAVQPPGRFGALDIQNNTVLNFQEKPNGDGSWINGGFFIFKSKIFDYIENDQTVLEKIPLENLAKDKQLKAHFHNGFWQPMDTLRDKNYLENLWQQGSAPWKIW